MAVKVKEKCRSRVNAVSETNVYKLRMEIKRRIKSNIQMPKRFLLLSAECVCEREIAEHKKEHMEFICILKNLYFNDLRLVHGGKRNEYKLLAVFACICLSKTFWL